MSQAETFYRVSFEVPREVGDAFAGIAGPLGLASQLHHYENNETVVFTAGGVGLPANLLRMGVCGTDRNRDIRYLGHAASVLRSVWQET